jgi:hypothetical protein
MELRKVVTAFSPAVAARVARYVTKAILSESMVDANWLNERFVGISCRNASTICFLPKTWPELPNSTKSSASSASTRSVEALTSG